MTAHLHAEADAEVGHAAARARSGWPGSSPRFRGPRSPPDQDPVEPGHVAGEPLALDALGVHPHHLDRGLVGDAAVASAS